MKFERNLVNPIRKIVGFVCLAVGVVSTVNAEAPYKIGDYYWPTPNSGFLRGKGEASFLQPTVSGRLSSALFGCVRNNGTRFHEGIDLKPIIKDGHGEALDGIFAFTDGVVRYVNLDAGASSYGRYVVVEHPSVAPGIMTLYAHLRSVEEGIVAGVAVQGGVKIATMGRSADSTIPKSRAHLHFEVAYWLGPDFQKWYDLQPFSSENEHGAFNGMNLVGFDVWSFWRALRSGEVTTLEEFIESEPVAFVVEVPFDDIPDLIQTNPQLMTNDFLPTDLGGWRIEFTWYGAPIRWTALSEGELEVGELTIVESDESYVGHSRCYQMQRGGNFPGPGSRMKNLISRLFVNH